MTDRELLELAAKSAKIDLIPMKIKNVEKRGDDSFIGYMTKAEQWHRGWFNPLTDDGDALRLAVLLQMDLSLGLNGCTVDGAVDELCSEDPYAATRRAIVRAAALITKVRERR